MPKSEWLVYWINDDSCTLHREHGLIGVTMASRLYFRLRQHEASRRIPKPFRYEIIFRGSQKEALALEAELRPRPGIGWNVGVGGFPHGGGLRGVPKSPEHRAKQNAAALARYAKPGEKEKTSKAVKRGLKNVNRTGVNNSNYGKTMSEETKNKIRQRIIERGGVSGSKNPNYRG